MYRYIKSNRDDGYFGQVMRDKYADLIKENYSGQTISKRVDMDDQPGGLKYEADQLGIDMYDLLECLEGMRYNREAVEIEDGVYRIL